MKPRKLNADVAELADALVSGSSEAIHVGSSPVIRTTRKHPGIAWGAFCVVWAMGIEGER